MDGTFDAAIATVTAAAGATAGDDSATAVALRQAAALLHVTRQHALSVREATLTEMITTLRAHAAAVDALIAAQNENVALHLEVTSLRREVAALQHNPTAVHIGENM
jgi:hypothetical protein